MRLISRHLTIGLICPGLETAAGGTGYHHISVLAAGQFIWNPARGPAYSVLFSAISRGSGGYHLEWKFFHSFFSGRFSGGHRYTDFDIHCLVISQYLL